MTVITLPVVATASQTLNAVVNRQFVRLDLYQRSTGLYLNLWQGNALTVAGALCQNLRPILHADYLGLGGDFVFVDTEGASDPTYDGLGTRYRLTFVSAS